ncbi:betaine-aldehyde dehydrogenase [Actinoplanes octamycinicus]|uniref:Betaine-aldehyde dehydrogenase n=1 Tax=Actinoplanes octamycinicus TaxID=135948 RepID=A0A7W7M8C5_9ACTN|nr:aminobutyraldehyde dehydrogenase [Actinoplanes octamycinicus]MBB4740656.1 betaine-aldehyde dehydrogenase [Actinoplanes octamycinicus]GIE63585.1 gamma-aminobutyraldehyde dehydrogenase [Actinoplanes octamycinicus]
MSTDIPVLRNFVNGSFADTEEGRTSPVVDPSTGETYAHAPVSSARDVAAAVDAATAGFEVWRDTTPAERQRALLRIADAVEARAEELIEAECRNTGKPIEATRAEEMGPVLDELRFFAGAARMLEGKAAGEYLRDHTSYVRREPIGVCAQITPWNYPLVMAIWKLAPAIAAGNSVVLKPSDTTPVSTLLLAGIAAEFLPAGVLNVVCGDRDTGRALVSHPVPQMVSITGSTRAGTEVAAAAAPDLKKVHLELGGKAPVVVFDDVDIAATAEAIAGAGFFNAGQDCTAATRVLVHERIAADFTAALAAAAKNTRVGAPSDPDAFFGPVNNLHQLERVAGFLDRTPAHAEVVAGGNRIGERGFFFEPTVVAGLRQRDEMIQDEVFGPVITVQPFTDEAEAVRFANDVRYGLSASVWTQNHGRAMRVSRRLDFGAVWINTHLPFVSEMPHGGYGHSGYGKDLSMYGFEEYTRIKHVMSFHG